MQNNLSDNTDSIKNEAERKAELKENLETVRKEIQVIAKKCSRKPEDIRLLAVSKTHPISDIKLAYELGQRDFAENKVQELSAKIEALADYKDINWHLIGTLQRNKVKFVVGQVSLIHSVDSLKLIRRIANLAEERGVCQDILLQVNIAEEESKHGFALEEVSAAVDLCQELEHIRLRGLMCMAPFFDNPENAYPVFARCYDLFLDLKAREDSEDISILSMGMSGDFPQAIRAGATDLRIGSNIFGARDYSN